MAEKMLKIVQEGRESFIPDNQRNRSFWTKQNAKVAGSYNAQREFVTILPATAEEMAMLEQQNTLPTVPKITATPANEIESLKQQVAQMQEMISKLTQPAEEPKEKGKPGPKPKTDKDGEGQ